MNLMEKLVKSSQMGYIPNDLYDQRDLLVDQLSQLVNIKVKSVIPTQLWKC